MLPAKLKKMFRSKESTSKIDAIIIECQFALKIAEELRAERLALMSQFPHGSHHIKVIQDNLTRQRLLSELHRELNSTPIY